MKIKTLSLIVLATILVAACSTSPNVETTSAPVTEQQTITAATDSQENTASNSGDSSTAAEVSFSKDIFPVIQQFALPAHGQQQKGGISLANYEDIMEYVVPGDPAASELYKRLTGDGVPVMPPTGKLPDDTIQLFYDWIAQGAKNN
ncbi:MAG: hypothetical protein GYA18_02150 [Chloroflexi bacterium]|jgi:hypothetical protein|nr:hypothetical protein [Chloroflexota bacterium]